MPDSLQEQIEKLRASLVALQAQRAVLGDVLEPAIAATQQQLAALEAQAAPAPPTEERRLITILFTDIVGSTSLAEKLDPEEWRQTVAQVHSTVGNIIAEHQGTVAQYLGDGLLAFFGADESREQDAENAIRAALQVQNSKFEIRNSISSAVNGLPSVVTLRVGIHTGLVVVGELGADAHKEFTATGDAMNLAARLQSAAPPGGILISDDTYRYVRGVFDVTPQPPLTVKGKREPLATFLVRRAKPRAFRVVTRGVSGVQTRTIGRDTEMERLRAAYLDAYENRRVVWAQLLGEPGVGKSRLMQEIDDWIELRDETVRSFQGRAFAGEQNQPFALIRRVWFDRFQIADDAPLAQAEAKWVERFREQTGIEEAEPAHVLGLLVGLPFGDSPYIGAMRNESAQVRGRAYVVSKQALRRIRATVPVQLKLEDLHWADGSSLDYLREVFWNADSGLSPVEDAEPLQGIFVMASARPEWTGVQDFFKNGFAEMDAGSESASLPVRSAVLMPLAPLTDSATRELAQELVKDVRDVPPNVVDLIVERAEGVPYFAEEMVNYFLDRGIIDRSVEPWQFVAGRLHESPLPTTLQHLLLTRLGALSDTERAALQRGAIFGRHFWTGGVQALGVLESEQVLEPLQPRGFLEIQPDSALEGEREWSFHHALLREVTYESVLKRERATLHKKAADWLEQQAERAGRLDEFAGLLGEHAERAGELNAAADWYIRAGERASQQGAYLEARHFFDRALDLLPPIEQERRWKALNGRSRALETLGDHEQSEVDAQAMLTLAEQLNDDARRAHALFSIARTAVRRGDNRTGSRFSEQAAVLADKVGDRLLALQTRALLAFALKYLGEWQAALEIAEQVLVQARTMGDDPRLAGIIGNVGAVMSDTGDIARGLELQLEAEHLARRVGDRARELTAVLNSGYTYIQLGLYKQARATLERALALAEAIAARQTRAYALSNLGLAYFRLADGRAARRLLEESIAELIVLRDAFALGAALQYLGYELEREGDLAGATRRLQEAREHYAAMEASEAVYDVVVALARCAFGQGQLDEAREYTNSVWELLTTHGPGAMEFPTWAYWTCADLFDALGDTERSRAAVTAGHRALIQYADKISNPEWRRSYLENVPENRAMVEMWERTVTSGQ